MKALVAVAVVGLLGGWMLPQRPVPTFALIYVQSQPVEQQGQIANPTGCIWDADDMREVQASGVWPPGASATYEMCVVGDWTAHDWPVATTDSRLTVTVEAIGGPASASCLHGPRYDHSASLPPVGDGVGIIWTVRFTARNDSGQRVGNRGHPATVTGAGYPDYIYSNGALLTNPYLRTACPGWSEFPYQSGSYPGPYWEWQ